jgi:hypothetical protein
MESLDPPEACECGWMEEEIKSWRAGSRWVKWRVVYYIIWPLENWMEAIEEWLQEGRKY